MEQNTLPVPDDQQLSSEKQRLALFQQLTPTQQRLLLLSTPDDTLATAAARCGISAETPSAWLNAAHLQYAPAFKQLWYSRATDTVAYLEKLLELHGTRNLERANKVAALLDREDITQLKERTLGIAASQALKLALAPIEASYKRQKREDDSEDQVYEIMVRIRGRKSQQQGNDAALPEQRIIEGET